MIDKVNHQILFVIKEEFANKFDDYCLKNQQTF